MLDRTTAVWLTSDLVSKHRLRPVGLMAKCERGYLCDVCDEEVAEIVDSDLYLRYIIGEIGSRELLSAPERHIRCNPVQAQFIADSEFTPVDVDGPFDKRELDTEFVREREDLVTRGWKRLQAVQALGIPISQYPLSETSEDRNA